MRRVTQLAAAILLVALAASPGALAQANGKPAPGGTVDGAAAALNAAGGVGPDGKPAPPPTDGKGIGQKGATAGENMKKGDTGKPAQ